MQWQEFKRIVEEEVGIGDDTELWKIDINLPTASEFLRVDRDALLGVSITIEEFPGAAAAAAAYQAAA
jgi:hypothetical protein